MASLLNVVLFGALLVGHTLLAAVMTRFFRIRLRTQWGWVVYAVVGIPFVLVVSTLVFTGVLGIGVDLGTPAAVVAVLVGMPMVLGITVDVLYVPSPEEYELPDTR